MSDTKKTGFHRATLTGLAILLSLGIGACGAAGDDGLRSQSRNDAAQNGSRIDGPQMLADLEFLSSDELLGRRTGTPGSAEAREYLIGRFQGVGLEPLGDSYTQEFTFTGRRDDVQYEGVNIIGHLRGREEPDRYIVVTAHYDHLGVGRPDESGDSIYNGADDNAAGAAALATLAEYFHEYRPAHSMIFVAFDAEELGLQGARAFVANPPVPLESIAFNINMDMISRNDQNELYAVGTYHYPFLVPYVERVAAKSSITLLMGHDSGEVRSEDWTNASDHGAFHAQGIPFLYFGVEDHEDYHRPSDEFEKIHPEFYQAAVETILDMILEVDAELPSDRSAEQDIAA